MTKRWMMGVAAAALTVATAVAAQAADLPTRKAPPAPIFVPPPFTWTGFYVGLNAGGVWSSGSRNATLYAPGAAFVSRTISPAELEITRAALSAAARPVTTTSPARRCSALRPISTGRAWARHSTIPALRSAPLLMALLCLARLWATSLSVHAKANLDWIGTVRGRIGFVATPDNRLMIYGTGGFAYAGGSSNFSVYDATQGAYLER